jgi:CheY-like chemotaxis protein
MKVMVVDDEQDVQFLFQQHFRKELKGGKIQFCFAFSGEEALQYLTKQGTTDLLLILSDINMPGMNGLELLKRIKEKFSSLPVFMITAYSEESNRQQALAFGCDDYLTKPIDFDLLKSRIFGL